MPNLQAPSFYIEFLILFFDRIQTIIRYMNELVLSFDVGTQSTRAAIVDKNGCIKSFAKTDYKRPFIKASFSGQAEQKPDFYYEMVCRSAQKLDKKLLNRVKAVTLSTFRDSCVLLDNDLTPLTNVILWMDERKVKGDIQLPFLKKTLFCAAGVMEAVNINYKTTRYNWIKENEHQLLEKTAKYVMLSTYLNYRLTGVLKDSKASQVGHIPFDAKKRTWIKKDIKRCVFDIPMEMLCDLTEAGTEIGKITQENSQRLGIAKNLPLIATGTDKGCESLGLSVTGEGKAAVSLGTAATIQFCSQRYFSPKPFIPAYPAVIPNSFNAETQIYRGYWTVKWFIENFCAEEQEKAIKKKCSVEKILDSYLDETPAGCEGLLMTPHLAAGIWNPYAKGMFFGLSDKHSKKHMYRAIIEGIDFELYHCMQIMEKRAGYKIKEVYAAGGGSVSDKVLQIMADMFGLPVKRVQTHEVTVLGSSMAAFCYLGLFKSFQEASKAMVHDSKTFVPDMEKHLMYREIYKKIYRYLEKSNTCMFKKSYKLNQNE